MILAGFSKSFQRFKVAFSKNSGGSGRFQLEKSKNDNMLATQSDIAYYFCITVRERQLFKLKALLLTHPIEYVAI